MHYFLLILKSRQIFADWTKMDESVKGTPESQPTASPSINTEVKSGSVSLHSPLKDVTIDDESHDNETVKMQFWVTQL